MPPVLGSRLVLLEVLRLIGAGGLGEVYAVDVSVTRRVKTVAYDKTLDLVSSVVAVRRYEPAPTGVAALRPVNPRR
jgi:hypothetical protein